DKSPIQVFSISNYLKYWNHNNRFSAVCHAVYQFIDARSNFIQQVINDKSSLIFNHK
ncbi:2929_t:CDS:2, partial [Funneliformis geosporum]